MYHQLSNALPPFLSEDNDDDVIQKRKKTTKELGQTEISILTFL